MTNFRLKPGTVLAEKYRLESVLGTGGMGTVYQAEHLALKAPVAVKVIDREVDEGDVALARFMREAQSAASLRSPHVVQILDYGMEGKRPFMVMEMLEGEPLATRIKRLGRLSPQETFRVISHVSRAVSKAHEADIIHRDLKPDNVFLVHNEGDEIAKVLDFGVAKVESTQLDGEGHTRTGSLLGTPYYMSPEQAQGNKDIDARSDLWALGVIAFECMTGKRPFSSDGLGDLVLQICIRDIPVPSKVVPVPPGFDDWFAKACNRDPDARFQTARDLAESLRDALDLGSEAGAAIPESKWVSKRALLEAQTIASQAPTLSSETTVPDPSRRATNDDAVPTRVDPPLLDKENEEEEAAPNSRWEIVPHGERESTTRQDFVPLSESTADIERAAGLPREREESSGGGSVAFVAIIALMIGGAVVFGIRHIRENHEKSDTQTVESRAIGSGTHKPSLKASAQKKDENESEPRPTTGSRPGEKNNPEANPDEIPANGTGTGATTAATEQTAEEAAEKALDALDTAAEEALKEREKLLSESDKAAQEKDVTSKDATEDKGSSGPQPKLPDGLAPAPAPPPPTPAPAPAP